MLNRNKCVPLYAELCLRLVRGMRNYVECASRSDIGSAMLGWHGVSSQNLQVRWRQPLSGLSFRSLVYIRRVRWKQQPSHSASVLASEVRTSCRTDPAQFPKYAQSSDPKQPVFCPDDYPTTKPRPNAYNQSSWGCPDGDIQVFVITIHGEYFYDYRCGEVTFWLSSRKSPKSRIIRRGTAPA